MTGQYVDAQSSPATYDLSDGKALRADLSAMFGDQRITTINATSDAPAALETTCMMVGDNGRVIGVTRPAKEGTATTTLAPKLRNEARSSINTDLFATAFNNYLRVKGAMEQLEMPEESNETKAQEFWFNHVFAPTNGWTSTTAFINNNQENTTVYLSAQDENKKLGRIALTTEPGKPITVPTSAFSKISGNERITGVYGKSTQPVRPVQIISYTDEQGGEQYIMLPAHNGLDKGKKLFTFATPDTSIVVRNTTSKATSATINCYNKDKQVIASTNTTIAPNSRIIGTLAGITNADLTEINNAEIETSGDGEIIGTTIYNQGGIFTGTNMINNDDVRFKMETTMYNARKGVDIRECNDGPAQLTFTVKGKAKIGKITYDPLRKGELNKGFSATLSTTPARSITGTVSTVNGIMPAEFNNTWDYVNIVPGNVTSQDTYENRPTITIYDQNNQPIKTITTRLQTPLEEPIISVAQERNDTNYAYNAIKNDIPGIAGIMAKHANEFAAPENRTGGIERWISVFTIKTDDAAQNAYRITGVSFTRSPTINTMVQGYRVSSPGALTILKTPGGQEFMKALEDFFSVGHTWEYHPKPGDILTLPPQ
jgi:hypothetical protein